MRAVPVNTYDQVLVNVPHLEFKRFMKIISALGVTVEKHSSMDIAMAQVESGQVYKADSVEDLKRLVD